MSNHESLPDAGLVLDLIVAFRKSKTMFAAVSLGVFDALSAGPKSLESLCDQFLAQADSLERLLDACVGLGLLEKMDGRYANTPAASAYLTSNSPNRLTGYINYSNDVMWRLWAGLESAVVEGTNRWKDVFGSDGPIFSHFFRDEKAKYEFLMGMHGYGVLSSPKVVAAFDLSKFKRLVDLGGATGHLAIAATERYPGLKAAVYDLPEVTGIARDVVSRSSSGARIEVLKGDFFEDPLPEADLFALGRILHDWSEPKIKLLLAKIHDRLPAGGAFLIAEKLLDADKLGPSWAQLQNLNMLICTEGKERTLVEYSALLEEAGFTFVEAHQTDSPLDAVLATKGPVG